MAYVGREPRHGFLEGQTSTFNGSTTTVTLQRNVSSTDAIDVYIDNVHQEPDVAYTLSSGGDSITFTGTPENGAKLYVRFHGITFDTARANRLINTDGGSTATLADNDTFTMSLDGTTVISASSSGVTIPNLTVTGTTTSVNSTNLEIGDNKITLNSDVASNAAPSENAGITINRGSSADVDFIWNETNDEWYAADDLATGGIFRVKGGGTTPTLSGSTLAAFTRSAATNNASIAIIGNSGGYSSVHFGDENDEDVGQLNYSHTADAFSLNKGLGVTGNITASGTVGTPAGSIAAPAYTFSTDTNTGMFKRGTDQIGFSAGGTEMLALTSTGIFADKLGNKSTGSNLTLDAAGDIILDADGGAWRFKDNGGSTLEISTGSGTSPVFFSPVSNADIIFKGNDGGSVITALTLDMSEAGKANFNGDVDLENGALKVGGTTVIDSSRAITATGATISGAVNVSAASPNIDVTDTGTSHASQDFLTNSNTIRATIGVERSAGGGLFVGSSAYAAVFGTASSGSTQFATNNNVRMTISSSGSVGIGTSSVDRGKAHINHYNSVSGGVFNTPHIALSFNTSPTDNDAFAGITYATSDSDNYGWSVGAKRTSSGIGDFVFTQHTNSASGSTRMRLDASGNVGIGIDPQVLLHVQAGTTGNGTVRIGGGAGLQLSHNNSGTTVQTIESLYRTTSASANLQIKTGHLTIFTGTSGAQAMVIMPNGNVGIKEGNPSHELTVAGNSIITKDFGTALDRTYTGAPSYSANGGDLLTLVNSADAASGSQYASIWVQTPQYTGSSGSTRTIRFGGQSVPRAYSADFFVQTRGSNAQLRTRMTVGEEGVMRDYTGNTSSNYKWFTPVADDYQVREYDFGNRVYIKKDAGGSGNYNKAVFLNRYLPADFDMTFELEGGTPSSTYRHFAILLNGDGGTSNSNWDHVVLRQHSSNSNLNTIRWDNGGTGRNAVDGSSNPNFFDGTKRRVRIEKRYGSLRVEVSSFASSPYTWGTHTGLTFTNQQGGYTGFVIYEPGATDTWVEISNLTITEV